MAIQNHHLQVVSLLLEARTVILGAQSFRFPANDNTTDRSKITPPQTQDKLLETVHLLMVLVQIIATSNDLTPNGGLVKPWARGLPGKWGGPG